MRFALLLVPLVVSCGPVAVTTPPRSPDSPFDVDWRMMVRDRQTLSAYTGQTVRFRLDRGECMTEGRTVRAWYGDRFVPATLIVQCPDVPPDAHALVVVGVVGAPASDGIKRGRWIDYCVEVRAVSVVAVVR